MPASGAPTKPVPRVTVRTLDGMFLSADPRGMRLRPVRSISAVVAIALPSFCNCASRGQPPSPDVEPVSVELAPPDATVGGMPAPEVASAPTGANLGAPQGGTNELPVRTLPPSLPGRDSVVAILRVPDVDVDAVRQRIEEVTSAQVEGIRKGPAGLLAVHFAPLSPPRTEADLLLLVGRLRELPEFRAVEPERRFRAQEHESPAP